MKFYYYRVYGLYVESQLEIPELVSGKEGKSDVSIRFGTVPDLLPEIRDQGVFYQAANNDFLLHMDGVGKFRVQNGSKIILSFPPEISHELQRVFLMGSVFGALLHQKGVLALHGSAVAIEGGAMIITGTSSSGKSTLAATLSKKGFPFIADDISALYPEKEHFSVHHGIPQMKLWKDVLNKLFKNEPVNQVRPSIEKYRRKVVEGFMTEPREVKIIIVLSSNNSKGIEIDEIKGMDKFELLQANTYRYRFLSGLDRTEDHFLSITRLANCTKVYRVSRPSSPFSADELSQKIIDEVISQAG